MKNRRTTHPTRRRLANGTVPVPAVPLSASRRAATTIAWLRLIAELAGPLIALLRIVSSIAIALWG
jgi:hypothetical protein